MKYRCFVKQEESQWVAVCVDLNIAVQRCTKLLAMLALERITRDYVKDAQTIDIFHAKKLLKRKSPLWIMFEYYKVLFFTYFNKPSDLIDSGSIFDIKVFE